MSEQITYWGLKVYSMNFNNISDNEVIVLTTCKPPHVLLFTHFLPFAATFTYLPE